MNLVVTVCTGDEMDRLGKITHPYMQRYAEKIGADFRIIKNDEDFSEIMFMKKHSIESPIGMPESCRWLMNAKILAQDELRTYERVVYLDSDILVLDRAVDVFEVVPEDKVGMFEEGTKRDDRGSLVCGMSNSSFALFRFRYNAILKAFGLPPLEEITGRYYNSGVMVFSRGSYFLEPPLMYITGMLGEQDFINFLIQSKDVPVFDLPRKFNYMCWGETLEQIAQEAAFFHHAGRVRSRAEQIVKVEENIKRLVELGVLTKCH